MLCLPTNENDLESDKVASIFRMTNQIHVKGFAKNWHTTGQFHKSICDRLSARFGYRNMNCFSGVWVNQHVKGKNSIRVGDVFRVRVEVRACENCTLLWTKAISSLYSEGDFY